MEQPVFTVSELNRRVKALLDGDPLLQSVCVRGELSNYKVYPSGHHYFTLKDAEGSLRCVMFRSSASRLRFAPENGMSAAAWGRITVYPRDGTYQLYCETLQPQGAGDLQLAFEQLKRRLAAEGLFDPAHKRPLPRFPERIAVVTSPAGAAVRDIIRVAGERWPMAKLLILPVRVQGAEAPGEIAAALRYAGSRKVADLVIAGRGGGSLEDLWAFNDERVARAIYSCEIPVISAVGHEPDVTIADYVADLRAATPSNAAELAVPDRDEQREALESAAARCGRALRRRLDLSRGRLEELAARRVLRSPAGYIEMKRMEVDLLRARLLRLAEARTAEARRSFVRMAASLDALSPLRVLSRGYTVVENSGGGVVRTPDDVAVGEAVRVILSRGALACTVDGKMEREDHENGSEKKEL